MRDFHYLDPISLRAFLFAAQTGNFTEAARRASLTQSGISQHVSKLEQSLGIKLFLRNGKRVSITLHGKRLLRFIEQYADQVDGLMEELSSQERSIQGKVTYSMPNSCLMTPHFSMLLDKRKKFLGIDIEVIIAHSDKVIQKLIDGVIDFGFVTQQRPHPALEYVEFAREEYVLVGKTEGALRLPDPKTLSKTLKEQGWVNYPGMEVLFESWRKVYFPKISITLDQLHVTGQINDLNGAITMVKNGVGLSVFPKHCILSELNQGLLKSYPKLNEERSKEFPIWIAQRKDINPSARVKCVLDAFWEMVNE
jgi:DNA-binding transcriptional LysR family regulator